MEHGSRTRLLTALILAAVFGAGVVLGLAADSSLGAQPIESAAVPTEEPSDDEEPRRRSYTFEEVEPNEAQLALIDSIVAEHRARTNALDERLKAEYREGFRVIVLESREAIKAVLTPEQAAEYQRLLDERDARAAAERQNEDDRD
jgi:hypothetical protein